jgi:hypothetical protein
MVDPLDPGSKQPYHAVESLHIDEAGRRLERYRASADALAYEAMRSVAEGLRNNGYRVTSAGILESSGRKGGSLGAILASHALIHTADGDHFRNALSVAAERNGMTVSRVPARDLESQAAARIGCPVPGLGETVKELGRQVGPPWGADQKRAALLAWLLLCQAAAPRPRR